KDLTIRKSYLVLSESRLIGRFVNTLNADSQMTLTVEKEAMNDMTENAALLEWVDSVVKLCKPDQVHWCDGSEEEDKRLRQLMVDSGSAQWMNPEKRPTSLLVRSDPRDVARVESRTFIGSRSADEAGPTNNWENPDVMKARLNKLYDGCM